MKFGQGVKEDLNRRWKHYLSDFKDGIHQKSLSSSFFLFFACLAPAVTFGGILGFYTNGEIGAVEMILASAICGIIFSIISGQPLIILGGTGPMLVITIMLYSLAKSLGLDFLPLYFWVGMWTALLTILSGFLNFSNFMKYFTRFTDEIFAALISMIFIYEAIKSLVNIFMELDIKQHHDTALLSLLLALGTFMIANNLTRLRESRYLNSTIREFLSDFGPIIAIGAMTLVAFSFNEVHLDILPAPDTFSTTSGRDWFVNPWSTPLWAIMLSSIPAIFVTILVFLDQNITARLVNNPDHKLKKGKAYHWDMVVVGGLIGLCSIFGLPWLVAATVRSLNHVRGLAVYKHSKGQDNRVENKIASVNETRVTGLSIHILLVIVLFALPLIKHIPMAILYGLFLYMGIVSMKSNQFFERLNLWFMDPELYPQRHYTHKVPMKVIHRFTLIQFFALITLWVVKISPFGILFPLFIALLVPLRFKMNLIFKKEHLFHLDSEEEPEEEELQWV